MQTLQPNTLLQGGRYKILKVLGQGGFGITYLAMQSGLERKVAIKEFFMKELCDRDESTSRVTLGTSGIRETVNRFREKFLKEARNIARLNHPNIVRIIDVFEENGTAYYVMEYAGKSSLAETIKQKGCLAEPVAKRYILQVAEALRYIHQQKMNHLDVKPANIMINEKDEAVLIDFGLSKQYDASTGKQTSTTPVGISEGYAPMEQYKQGGVGEFSPETDIYALGATYFKLLTGTTPPSASDVNEDGVPVEELKAKGVSQAAIDTICKAMEGRKKDRMHDVSTFISAITYSNAARTSAATHTPNPAPTPSRTIVDDEATVLAAEVQTQKVELNKDPRAEAKLIAKAKREGTFSEGTLQSNEKQFVIWSIIIFLAIVLFVKILYNYNRNSKAGEPVQRTETSSNGAIEKANVENMPINNVTTADKTFTVEGVSFIMKEVVGGTFLMGAPPEDKDAFAYYAKPTHQVTLSDYYIGEAEVTQELWLVVMGKNPSRFKGSNLPVEKVSWNDCQKFICKLNKITGQKFRLPTEAEWEFAARGGNKSKNYIYSGSEGKNLRTVAWYGANSNRSTHAVKTKSPNELGIYDMSGNVCEWCNDWYGDYKSNALTNPVGPSSGSFRVLRGGGWNDHNGLSVSARENWEPDFQNFETGLRLAL